MDISSLVVLIVVSVSLGTQYLLEVHLEMPTNMHDTEAGGWSGEGELKKISHSSFWGELAPFQLTAFGVPLLVYDIPTGGTLLLIAVLLFLLLRKKCVGEIRRPTEK